MRKGVFIFLDIREKLEYDELSLIDVRFQIPVRYHFLKSFNELLIGFTIRERALSDLDCLEHSKVAYLLQSVGLVQQLLDLGLVGLDASRRNVLQTSPTPP